LLKKLKGDILAGMRGRCTMRSVSLHCLLQYYCQYAKNVLNRTKFTKRKFYFSNETRLNKIGCLESNCIIYQKREFY